MAELDVDIVSVEREIWSGKATFLFKAKTICVSLSKADSCR